MREKIFVYARKKYGAKPEYLWKRDSSSAVLRNARNRKWYAVIMRVPRTRLGLDGDGAADVMNVKADPDLIAQMVQAHGFLPGYHMNKKYWISLLLDESVKMETALDFLDRSYELVDLSK
ncbi:MAG: MmcQ/YjbR family DNA-binding protein [Lachnospiraceae bacterium]|nr:MmcQ/YjbR family DNA-binding protein [Lachnospiraceae bacterium]